MILNKGDTDKIPKQIKGGVFQHLLHKQSVLGEEKAKPEHQTSKNLEHK